MPEPVHEQIEYLPRIRIVPDPDQPRERIDPEHVGRLAKSLIERGKMLNPIRTRFDPALGKDVIVAGHQRWLAAEQAGFDLVPVIRSKGTLSPLDILVEQVVDNEVREGLRPCELARALDEIRRQSGGKSNAELAGQLGLNPSDFTVADALLSLSPARQQDVDAGLVGKQTAYYLARIDDPAMQDELWEQARSGQLNKEQAKAAVRSRAAHHNTKAGAGSGRITVKASGMSLTYRAEDGGLDGLLEALDTLRKEVRRGIDQGWDAKAFSRQMKNKVS
ncbi:ParB/RepB/Spo0J family partition protein [Tautonia marina]|uniref:ParB/RepB/Spo0J family partition protein n=1 Tax=Tautonia marina TaxID=2653855 RepID=UPI0013762CAA|nr:ParB N-terminal domain-containing protein [Tautonia marina]